MTNKEIARAFSDLSDIMELHNENPFKIRSYQNAYITLRKLDKPLSEMSIQEMDGIKGVGKAISEKIQELLTTGKMQTYMKYAEQTPPGVVEMLHIKGFGPKKVYAVWKDLEIETVGELLYACNENRLIELHGFGKKTQDEIRKGAEYYLKSKDKMLWAAADEEAKKIENLFKSKDTQFERVGSLRRLNPVVEVLSFLTDNSLNNIISISEKAKCRVIEKGENHLKLKTEDDVPILVYTCNSDEFGSKQFKYTGTRPFLEAFVKITEGGDFKNLKTEKDIFAKVNLPFIEPELREDERVLNIAKTHTLPRLITIGDIKGVIHSHTTYSDGLHSIEDMAKYAQQMGYQYIGITDHSKAAFYANGMKEDTIFAQWEEIDRLNGQFFNFKILKGIECDILSDGSLDYNDEILRGFDFVIASIHSNLKMTMEKATSRLIKAIENPFTTLLGHPTGRLLLSREGYPIDDKKVIDACAANKVAIEVNANPYRLDLDWTWLPYALERGVLVSINPDAHSCESINDIRYGINAARKGMLTTEGCLNALDVEGFLEFCQNRI